MRQLEISWPSIDATVVVDLIEDKNGELTDAVWSCLPYRTLQGHALVAGDCIYHVPPAHGALLAAPDHRVDRQAAPLGTVFCSAAQHLTIKYGDLTEPMPASPIGVVQDADVGALPEIGRRVWESVHGQDAPIVAEVRRLGGTTGHAVHRLLCQSAAVRDLVEEISAHTESALVEPPDEILAVHAGRIKSGAGTKQTLLTTLLFVNGETRPLGYMTYTNLLRAARLTKVPLEALIELTAMLVVKPSEFLGYCGLETLWDLTRRTVDVVSSITDRSDFAALMSHMALYTNALGAWNLQLFPWHLEQSALSDALSTAATGPRP